MVCSHNVWVQYLRQTNKISFHQELPTAVLSETKWKHTILGIMSVHFFLAHSNHWNCPHSHVSRSLCTQTHHCASWCDSCMWGLHCYIFKTTVDYNHGQKCWDDINPPSPESTLEYQLHTVRDDHQLTPTLIQGEGGIITATHNVNGSLEVKQ